MSGARHPDARPAFERKRARLAALVALTLAAGPLAAEPAIAQKSPASSASRIGTTTGADTDRAIERRLHGIFAELDGLEDVRVRVRDGVAELRGEALSSESRRRAVRLAHQISGVVEVEDRIEEVRDVQRRIAPVLERLGRRGEAFLAWLPLLGVAAIVLAAFALLAWVAGRWNAPFRRLARNRFLAELLQQVIRAAIALAGIVIAFDILDAGALVGTVLGAAGIFGLALGFALRDTVENYIASLLLSLRQPFAHDDLVRIEGWEGRVLRLTSRTTVLMSADGNHVRIPNAIVYKSVIVNYTRDPLRRFHFDLAVGTTEDLAAAQQLGADTLLQMEGVARHPPPEATIESVGDSAVTIRMAGWVDQRQVAYHKVRSEALRLVKRAFDGAGVSRPSPSYSVRLHDSSEGGPEADPTSRAEPGPAVPIDIGPRDALGPQIRNERRGYEEQDLLAPDAPKE